MLVWVDLIKGRPAAVIRCEANLNKEGVASMNELGLFTLTLGMTESWKISDPKFSWEKGRLDLW